MKKNTTTISKINNPKINKPKKLIQPKLPSMSHVTKYLIRECQYAVVRTVAKKLKWNIIT
jgi:hypothetical protein